MLPLCRGFRRFAPQFDTGQHKKAADEDRVLQDVCCERIKQLRDAETGYLQERLLKEGRWYDDQCR
jgi:hypothetical protein